MNITQLIEQHGSHGWTDALRQDLGPWLLLQLEDLANVLEIWRKYSILFSPSDCDPNKEALLTPSSQFLRMARTHPHKNHLSATYIPLARHHLHPPPHHRQNRPIQHRCPLFRAIPLSHPVPSIQTPSITHEMAFLAGAH